MEFNEKLQELRKRKGLTQEELAERLYVSRTAVSKWEQGRGYPGIDSLKRIAEFFSVTIDELLSGSEVLTIAEEDNKQNEKRLRNLVCGLLDLSTVLFFVIPLFGERKNGTVNEATLAALTEMTPYLRALYLAVVIALIVTGVLTLALQSCRVPFWERAGSKVSLALNAAAVLLFIVSLQPYAAAMLFIFLAVKVVVFTKRR